MRLLVGALIGVTMSCTKEREHRPPPPTPPAVITDAAVVTDAPAPPIVRNLPSTIKDGFHRHDRAADPPLWPGTPPAIGQQIKLQIVLSDEVDDGIGWLAMGGSVTKVISPTKVEGELVATTDKAPKAFAGVWRATLELDLEYDQPWVLTSIVQIDTKTPAD